MRGHKDRRGKVDVQLSPMGLRIGLEFQSSPNGIRRQPGCEIREVGCIGCLLHASKFLLGMVTVLPRGGARPSRSTLAFDDFGATSGLPTISTPWILHRLRSLDTSLNFLRYLHCLIQHDEEEQYLPSLQASGTGVGSAR